LRRSPQQGTAITLTSPPIEGSLDLATFLTSPNGIDSAQICLWEIVSDSPRNIDYCKKRAEYNAIEIPEYWIIDFSDHKVTVLLLEDGLYEEIGCRGDEVIESLLFPELKLTPAQILASQWGYTENQILLSQVG